MLQREGVRGSVPLCFLVYLYLDSDMAIIRCTDAVRCVLLGKFEIWQCFVEKYGCDLIVRF